MENTKKQPCSLVAEIQLVYHNTVKPSQMPKVTCSKDAYDILIGSWDPRKINLIEQCKVLLLNRGNKVLGICEISSGGMAGTIVDIKLVFAAALKTAASGIIIAHNHPSGNLTASREDLTYTTKLKLAGELLDLPLLDHIIISSEGFISLVDQGLM